MAELREKLNDETPETQPDFIMMIEPGLEKFLAEFNIQIGNNGIFYNHGENGSTSWEPDRLKMVYLRRDKTTAIPTLIIEITPKDGDKYVKRMPLSRTYDEPVLRDDEGLVK